MIKKKFFCLKKKTGSKRKRKKKRKKMVKLNNLLTLIGASSLYSVVAGYQHKFEGECLDLFNTIGEKYSIEKCEIDENGKMIRL